MRLLKHLPAGLVGLALATAVMTHEDVSRVSRLHHADQRASISSTSSFE